MRRTMTCAVRSGVPSLAAILEDTKMADKHVDVSSQSAGKFSGQDARRNFLKTSGRVAIAAPAVVLLLSAGSKNANAQGVPYTVEDDV
jgi:hypothetical protein